MRAFLDISHNKGERMDYQYCLLAGTKRVYVVERRPFKGGNISGGSTVIQ